MTEHQNHENQNKGPERDADRDADRGAEWDAAVLALFAQARATPEALPDRLFGAIVADAAAVQADLLSASPMPSAAEPRSLWQKSAALIGSLGGWGTVSGLVAASCTGLWIGLAAPETLLFAPGLSTLTATQSDLDYTTYETFDLASILVEDMQ